MLKATEQLTLLQRIGSSVFETINEWEKDPAFRKAVDEHVEKARLAKMLKDIRKRENRV